MLDARAGSRRRPVRSSESRQWIACDSAAVTQVALAPALDDLLEPKEALAPSLQNLRDARTALVALAQLGEGLRTPVRGGVDPRLLPSSIHAGHRRVVRAARHPLVSGNVGQ
jgi:hypothetical protein